MYLGKKLWLDSYIYYYVYVNSGGEPDINNSITALFIELCFSGISETIKIKRKSGANVPASS
jgi:hypothetical protein